MFAGLAEKLLHHESEATRTEKRTKKPFLATYSLDNGATWLPAYGLNMSLDGMSILVQQELVDNELPLRLPLDSFVLDVRVRPVWHVAGRYRKGIAHEYGV